MLRALAVAGDPATIAEARKRYAAGRADPSTLTPPLKDTVIGIVGRNADEKTYADLMQAGAAAKNPVECRRIFRPASVPKTKRSRRRAAGFAVASPQFSSFAPIIVAIVGQDHPEMAWAFFTEE